MKIILLLLIFSLFFVPINIVIHFQKYQSSAIISVELSKILKLILSLPKMNIEIKTFLFKKIKLNLYDKGFSQKKLIAHWLINYLDNLARYYTKSIIIKQISVKIHFSSRNAALTGILAGHMWSILYFILGKLSFLANIKKTKITVDVSPEFNDSRKLTFYAKGILAIRLGHIIIVGIFVLLLMIKRQLLSILKGTTYYGRSSNREPYENSNGKY
ncbi:MAG TPA: DUF2953 domain-containing protein [Thermoanaerobacterales bacterium]|nr:DUF2953 domain-containing protein [Thermoanaerobacterales bacterium]